MADTPKNPQKKAASAGNPASPRRVTARKLREQRRQRLVVTITAVAIGLALLAVLGGAAYDQLWVPSRPVASVGTTTLDRRAYWGERKNAYAREIVQNFQLLALFGGNPQFTQQFQGQSPVIDGRIETIRRDPVDDTVVEQWQTRQVKELGAAGLGITVSQDEVNQAMAQDLGVVFLPPPTAPVTTTATADPAAAASPAATVAVTGTITATPVPSPTVEPTPTLEPTVPPSPTPGGPTATPEPSPTPPPTPAPAEAATQVDQVLNEIFRRYELELAATEEDPDLTRDDFRAALNDQFREQVLNERIQAQLVPEEGFAFSEEPARVQARQVLIAVTPAAGATQEQIDAAFTEARPGADAVAAALRGNADFATVAAESSDDPGSREQGGDLGLFDENGVAANGATYPPELVQQAFALEPGTISDPIRTQFGWHVIEVTNREVPSREDQLREARTERLDQWVEEQRTALGMARFPALTPSPTTGPTTPSPTAMPTFLPGPPTAVPTEIPPPVETPAAATPTVPVETPAAATPTVPVETPAAATPTESVELTPTAVGTP